MGFPKKHIPVLCPELIRYLQPQANQDFIDATVGLGGHARAILRKIAPKGKVLGIDWDEKAIENLKFKIQNSKIKERLILFLGNFKNIKEIAEKRGFKEVSGIYFDLGLGSWQIEDERYGLSFQKEGPLDMRIGKKEFSAKEIVNKWPKEKLTEIFRKYGQVRRPHQIAEKIIRERSKEPIRTTLDLVKATGIKNPSVLAKIFQALRIVVNDELENLKKALPLAISLLKKGGRLAVISYHSGEDRIVKNFLKEKQKEGILKILTKKPIRPTEEEIQKNPRARSAKLRAALKISN